MPDAASGRPLAAPHAFATVRRLLWAWWLWAGVSVASLGAQRWTWAVAAGALSLVCYLLAPVESPPQYGLEHNFGVESDEFLATVAGATGVPFSPGHSIDLLNNGDAFYPAMLRDIARAERCITIEAYIYWAGAVGSQFAQALAERATGGVTVKILLDAVGSSNIGADILRTLEAGGCHLAWYNRLRWDSLGRINHRTHRKSLIVDGCIGYTGGAGIADHWTGDAQDAGHWRDMQVRIEGPAAAALQTGFAQNWLQTTHELVSGDAYYPPASSAGPTAAQVIMSSPEAGASAVRIMYYLAIVAARHSIYIANPYFVPDEMGLKILIDARRRGVDVRIMVSGLHNDNWLARRNSVRLYGALLEADVAILEYNRTMLHHKTMVVDRVWSTIGTANFDNRSFAHNEESNLCLRDEQVARELEATFLADAARCDRVTLGAWQRRPLWHRCEEVVASWFEDQV